MFSVWRGSYENRNCANINSDLIVLKFVNRNELFMFKDKNEYLTKYTPPPFHRYC